MFKTDKQTFILRFSIVWMCQCAWFYAIVMEKTNPRYKNGVYKRYGLVSSL